MSYSSQITVGGELANLSFNDTGPLGYDDDVGTIWQWDDATWILAATFIIFSMQTGSTQKNCLLRLYRTANVLFSQFFEGFGMLESGIVSTKNEVNIMMKNVVDVVLGGLTYWIFGYGVSYGGDGPSWFVDSDDADDWTDSGMGATHATFLFQLSFATTATTIVSGPWRRGQHRNT